ncbi:unnamed protein product, partial [Mesorhabditis belari]|uniref:Uncharacterized protein n=1 Tax=Mesorhabditis belari TaxID=2138241 RepID=A0AAF3FD15_9BILA
MFQPKETISFTNKTLPLLINAENFYLKETKKGIMLMAKNGSLNEMKFMTITVNSSSLSRLGDWKARKQPENDCEFIETKNKENCSIFHSSSRKSDRKVGAFLGDKAFSEAEHLYLFKCENDCETRTKNSSTTKPNHVLFKWNSDGSKLIPFGSLQKFLDTKKLPFWDALVDIYGKGLLLLGEAGKMELCAVKLSTKRETAEFLAESCSKIGKLPCSTKQCNYTMRRWAASYYLFISEPTDPKEPIYVSYYNKAQEKLHDQRIETVLPVKDLNLSPSTVYSLVSENASANVYLMPDRSLPQSAPLSGTKYAFEQDLESAQTLITSVDIWRQRNFGAKKFYLIPDPDLLGYDATVLSIRNFLNDITLDGLIDMLESVRKGKATADTPLTYVAPPMEHISSAHPVPRVTTETFINQLDRPFRMWLNGEIDEGQLRGFYHENVPEPGSLPTPPRSSHWTLYSLLLLLLFTGLSIGLLYGCRNSGCLAIFQPKETISCTNKTLPLPVNADNFYLKETTEGIMLMATNGSLNEMKFRTIAVNSSLPSLFGNWEASKKFLDKKKLPFWDAGVDIYGNGVLLLGEAGKMELCAVKLSTKREPAEFVAESCSKVGKLPCSTKQCTYTMRRWAASYYLFISEPTDPKEPVYVSYYNKAQEKVHDQQIEAVLPVKDLSS